MEFGTFLTILYVLWNTMVIIFTMICAADRRDKEKEDKELEREAIAQEQLRNAIEFRHTLDKEALIREWKKIA